MKNFKVHFPESEREPVLRILSRSNDIILNQVEPESAFITIQLEDDEADALYDELRAQIDRELHTPEVVVVVVETQVSESPKTLL
jgi:hypothetical protein